MQPRQFSGKVEPWFASFQMQTGDLEEQGTKTVVSGGKAGVRAAVDSDTMASLCVWEHTL